MGHRATAETAPAAGADPAGPGAALASYYDQLRDALATMVQAGLVHGDLSAYNILAAGERLVIIDLPQIVDLVGNTQGMDFLLRDCANVCGVVPPEGPGGRRARAVRRADGATRSETRSRTESARRELGQVEQPRG